MTPYTHNLKVCRFTAFTLGLLLIVVVAGGAFGVVWLRQGVAQSARETKELNTRITQAERRSAALEARIAKAHSPQYLTARAPQGLRPTHQDQIVWMPRAQPLTPADYTDPTLAAPAEPAVETSPATPAEAVASTTPTEPAPAEATPQIVSFDLALSTVNEPVRRARNP